VNHLVDSRVLHVLGRVRDARSKVNHLVDSRVLHVLGRVRNARSKVNFLPIHVFSTCSVVFGLLALK